MLSVLVPFGPNESDATTMSGALGAPTTLSMVTYSAPVATLMLPSMSVCFTVRLWSPSGSSELVIAQLPEPSAVVVPSTVVPLVSKSVTVAPTSAPLPLTVGVLSLVMLSVFVPFGPNESDAATRSGALAAPATVSMVTASAADAALVLPAMSVCFTIRLWTPSGSSELVIVQLPEPSAVVVPSTVVPLVSKSVPVPPASAPPPLTVGVLSLVMLSVSELPLSDAAIRSGALGTPATVSMVTASAADAALVLPAMSVCFIDRL